MSLLLLFIGVFSALANLCPLETDEKFAREGELVLGGNSNPLVHFFFFFFLLQLLAMENSRMYNKLGLNWRLTKQHCHTNHSFMEYILVIDFLPKMQIYQPD